MRPPTRTDDGAAPDEDREGRRRRLRLLAAASLAALVVVAAVVAVGVFRPDPARDGSVTRVEGTAVRGAAETAALLRGLPQDGETLGRADAPVTILEVSDLKCPSCKLHAIEKQPTIVRRLVRTGRANLRLRLVNFRDPARGTTDGERARRFAYAFAPRDRFWSVAQTTFWNQGETRDEWATPSLLRAVARAAPGVGAAGGAGRETAASRALAADATRAAAALRTDATPAIYVLPRGSRTGVRVEDPGDVDAIADAVDAAAARAR